MFFLIKKNSITIFTDTLARDTHMNCSMLILSLSNQIEFVHFSQRFFFSRSSLVVAIKAKVSFGYLLSNSINVIRIECFIRLQMCSYIGSIGVCRLLLLTKKTNFLNVLKSYYVTYTDLKLLLVLSQQTLFNCANTNDR